MGFRKKIRSQKSVDVNYWRINSAHLLEDGTLELYVHGYADNAAYGNKAEPIDEYRCLINGIDMTIKSQFYELLERLVPIFSGGEKDIAYSKTDDNGADILVSVVDLKGNIIFQQFPQKNTGATTPRR
jgi:hypothetical protein